MSHSKAEVKDETLGVYSYKTPRQTLGLISYYKHNYSTW